MTTTTTKTRQTSAADLARGIDRLDASTAGRGYVYYADETASWYRVTAAEVRMLGELLRAAEESADDPHYGTTSEGQVYSEWCAATPSRQARAPRGNSRMLRAGRRIRANSVCPSRGPGLP
jgi:hypothetical protein